MDDLPEEPTVPAAAVRPSREKAQWERPTIRALAAGDAELNVGVGPDLAAQAS
jgi:hypothetical protein